MHLGIGSSGEVRGENEAARGAAVFEELVQTGLVEGRHRLVELLNLGRVDVDTHHGVAHRSERRCMDSAEVAATDHGDLHEEGPLLEVNSLGPVVPLGTPEMTS
ncbi:hypothetical protein D3C73_1355640 [compost metagenome]